MPTRKTFLTILSIIPTLIGSLALFAPATLLALKGATPSAAAEVMARTTGVLLVTIGILTFMVRDHEMTPTLRAVLRANLLLQLAILPIDPMAYAQGTFVGLGSFLPNTILHVVLALGLTYYLRR